MRVCVCVCVRVNVSVFECVFFLNNDEPRKNRADGAYGLEKNFPLSLSSGQEKKFVFS